MFGGVLWFRVRQYLDPEGLEMENNKKRFQPKPGGDGLLQLGFQGGSPAAHEADVHQDRHVAEGWEVAGLRFRLKTLIMGLPSFGAEARLFDGRSQLKSRPSTRTLHWG